VTPDGVARPLLNRPGPAYAAVLPEMTRAAVRNGTNKKMAMPKQRRIATLGTKRPIKIVSTYPTTT
jgi:hypothetical protein